MASRLRVAWIGDPKKLATKKDYPKPSLRDRLQKEGGWSFIQLTPREVKTGALQKGSYDIFIIPGGYAPNFADALGKVGGDNIRAFVEAGGGYVGICAGAYLGTSWGYDLLPVNVMDIEHWNRGKTDQCWLKTSPAGQDIAGTCLPQDFCVRYNNGPLFEILDSSAKSLVDFETQLRGRHGTFPPVMKGSPALVAGSCGQGRVLLISPHMEGSPEFGEAFRRLVAWTAATPPAVPAVPPVAPVAAPEAPVKAPAHEEVTEAKVSAIFEKFDVNKDGQLDQEELQLLLTSLASDMPASDLEEMLKLVKAQTARGGRISYEEFVAWSFGATMEGEGTDGEDEEMDKLCLVRMQSSAQYQADPEVRGEGGEATQAPILTITRTCSSGCSNQRSAVSEEKLEESVVTIQRAARAARAHPKAAAKLAAKAAAKPAAKPVAKAEAKAKAAPKAMPSPILQKGGLDLICCLGGPILITAPHSMRLMRGGGGTGEKSRLHKRERWTAEISMIVAKELFLQGLPASVMVWNRLAGPCKNRLDPNYLLRSQFHQSPWHLALHAWATRVGRGGPATDAGLPLFHVDLHGKVSEQLQLDLGAGPLEAEWPREDQSFVRALKFNFCKKLDKAMADCRVVTHKGVQISVDDEPRLHGFWGADTVTTISHQSVLLGIPAVQFEMPPFLRGQLVTDPQLARRFALAIREVYEEVVVPWWMARCRGTAPWPRTMAINPAAEVQETQPRTDFPMWAEQIVEELMEVEKAKAEDQI